MWRMIIFPGVAMIRLVVGINLFADWLREELNPKIEKVFAADDPSIKGALREKIKTSMMAYIETRMVNDTFFIFDAPEGKMLNLKFDKLHEGIVKKENFYVSCADFFDKNGKKIDLDFLVVKDGDQLKTIQAVVHAVDGNKRKYQLEG